MVLKAFIGNYFCPPPIIICHCTGMKNDLPTLKTGRTGPSPTREKRSGHVSLSAECIREGSQGLS